MTILLAITQTHWGGAQQYVYDIALGYMTAGHTVVVAAGEDAQHSTLFQKLNAKGIETHALRSLRRSFHPVHDILAIVEFSRLLQSIQPNLVHLNSSKMSIIGTLGLRHSRLTAKLIYTAHGWVFHEDHHPARTYVYTWLEKYTAPDKDAIITVSQKDADTAYTVLGYPKEKTHCIHLGISTHTPMPASEAKKKLSTQYGVPNTQGQILFGTIANFYHTKGIDIYLHALALLAKEQGLPPWHAIIIGDGEQKKILQSLIETYHLQQQVTLPGFIAEASSYVPAFDWYVLPSRKEGFPYVLLEAATANIPIIATNVGGVSEFVEDTKTGFLVTPKNPQDLRRALHDALQTPATTKESMQKNLAGALKQYQFKSMITQTLALVQAIFQEAP